MRPGDSVLNVGCSNGYLARKLAAAAGQEGHVTGVDPAQAAITYAQRRAAGAMTFTVGVAKDLPLPDASFDVVTSTLAIHHIPARKREAAFGAAAAALRPGHPARRLRTPARRFDHVSGISPYRPRFDGFARDHPAVITLLKVLAPIAEAELTYRKAADAAMPPTRGPSSPVWIQSGAIGYGISWHTAEGPLSARDN